VPTQGWRAVERGRGPALHASTNFGDEWHALDGSKVKRLIEGNQAVNVWMHPLVVTFIDGNEPVAVLKVESRQEFSSVRTAIVL
jgi:hypothetical protein